MKNFYQNLYYYLFIYYKRVELSGAEGSSCAVVTGLQCINIVSFIFLYNLMVDKPFFPSNTLIIITYILIFILNYFQYIFFEKKQLAIKNEWESKDEDINKKNSVFFWLYIILSITTFLILIFK